MAALAHISERSLLARPALSFAALASVMLAASLLTCAPAAAQPLAVQGGFAPSPYSATGENKPQPSFTLPTQAADVKDAVDEFTRLAKHEQWEKAFKSLDTIASKTTSGFIDRGDGVLVPSRLLLRGLLAGLPASGRNAYRLFYDSQATAIWDKAAGKGEADSLASIVNNHLISSVGDRAADRLGDLYFEQGNFEQAASAWQAIVSYCPESKLPKAQTLIKIATALARSGRWAELSTVDETLRERYASETVEIGGRRVAAADEIARLAAAARTSEPVVEAAAPLGDDFELPSNAEPIWQFRFQSKADPNTPNQPFALMDVYGRQRPNDFLIPAAADDNRVYVNLFGVEMAFDLATGKLLWRSGKLHLLQLQQNRQGVLPERYSIRVFGDRTWSVLRDPQQANQGVGFALVVRDAASGKEVFSSRRTLSAWNILSHPYLASEVSASDTLPSAPIAAGPIAAGPIATAPVGPPTPPAINFPNGFAGADDSFRFNGKSPKIAGQNLQLTDGGKSQNASIFARTAVSVTNFNTRFKLQLTNPTADGMTFTIQGVSPKALGKGGNGLGYVGMANSVTVRFDLFDNGGEGANSTGLCVNGAFPNATNSVNLAGTGIDLHSGHPLDVGMDYDGTTLQVTITDTATQASASESYPVNIPAVVGGQTAYVGFTGSTGDLTAAQNVLDWTFTATTQRRANLPVASTVYLAASRTGQGRELAVLVLNGKDGKLLKTISIGNYAVDQNQVYGDRIAQPSFLLHHDRLYVDTHGGALVSLQPQSGNLDWGALYDSPPPVQGYYYDYQPPQLGASGPIRAAGLLFAKGMRSPRLLGIRADGVTLVWNRPVSKTAVILGADDERLYMGGEELTAYSLKTQELLWATQLPRSAGWSEPLLTKNRLYQFTSRGICEVDKQTGEVLRIFRGSDLDSLGGTLFVTPGAVVTVSNLAITAYARKDAKPRPSAQALTSPSTPEAQNN